MTASSSPTLAAIDGDIEALEARELVPFRRAIEAGARMVMSGHVALPAITGDRSLPARCLGKLVPVAVENPMPPIVDSG